jgi:enoyl-CoA hydratase
MNDTPQFIQVESTDGIGRIRFNRPDRMNAFDNELMHETIAAVGRFDADDAVRAIVVSGNGRAFSAGFDLKAAGERNLDTAEKARAQLQLQYEFIMCFWHARKPTIAAVHGYCLAGAFELSLACDLTVAADDAIFGEPEVRFGTGTVAMLFPWVTGPKQAKEIVLLGDDRIPAPEALRMGLANRLVPAAEVEATALACARKIARASAVSVQLGKQAINRSYEAMGMRSALADGLDAYTEINATPSWEKLEFARIRKEQGVRAAVAWRDGRFKE